METKLQKFVKSRYKDMIAIAVILIVTLLLLMYFFRLGQIDLTIPFGYDGTDTMSSLVNAKLLGENAWNISTDQLAAPFTYYNYDGLISGMHNLDLLTMKFFMMLFGSAPLAVNLTFLTIFPTIAVISFGVLRSLKVKEWAAAAGGLTYAFMPFIFFRGVEHMVLSQYYFVPLSVLLCLWIYEDEEFFLFGKKFFHYKRNLYAVIMMIFIANNGIAYYQFFTCFFLIVAGLSKLVKTRKISYFGKAMGCVVIICTFLMISCLPAITSIMQNGASSSQYVRSVSDAEYYCLKIIQLIMPVRGHGIRHLQNIIQEYNEFAPLVTENRSAYLGIMGVIGFFILLVTLFTKRDNESKPYYKRICALSELNICAVLLGTLGGFGTMFFVFVSQTIRGYNRISVFIGFFCIATVCLLVNEISFKIKKVFCRTAFAVIMCILALLGIWEQNPLIGFHYETNQKQYESDDAFVKEIEANVEDSAMIYQLPYHEYPEGGTQVDMYDYELFVGYLHSDNLKWSYATTLGNEADQWNSRIASLAPDQMVKELKETGFSGIYINRKGYESEELEELENALTVLLNVTPVVSPDEHLSFFEFQ